MKVSKRKATGGEFCFVCGKELKKQAVVINLGSAGCTFVFCHTCARKMLNRLDQQLNTKEGTR